MPRINTGYREGAKEKIISAAIEVANERGWDAVTLDAIAKKVNVSTPALYSYFKNREELLREVFFRLLKNLKDRFESTVVEDDDIHATLTHLADILMNTEIPYAAILFQIPLRILQDPESVQEIDRILEESNKFFIRNCIELAQSRGQIPQEIDPDEAVCLINSITIGLQVHAPVKGLDNEAMKRIWITTIERYLQIDSRNRAS